MKLSSTPATMPGKRDRVRQNLMFEIDAEERDQDADQQQPADEQRSDGGVSHTTSTNNSAVRSSTIGY